MHRKNRYQCQNTKMFHILICSIDIYLRRLDKFTWAVEKITYYFSILFTIVDVLFAVVKALFFLHQQPPPPFDGLQFHQNNSPSHRIRCFDNKNIKRRFWLSNKNSIKTVRQIPWCENTEYVLKINCIPFRLIRLFSFLASAANIYLNIFNFYR